MSEAPDSRPNVFEPTFDEEATRPGFACRGAALALRAGAERLGASLYEVEPGQATVPYHWHAGNEELLIVLRGRPSLRTPEGWRELAEGEVVAFSRGERGAHQLANHGDSAARFVIFSEMRQPEVVVYPDSSKVGARSRADGIRLNFLARDAVDYWDGEEHP
jgi:uncharacterized cupin superfamily protein